MDTAVGGNAAGDGIGKAMFADVKFFWKRQRPAAFMFAVSLCALVASVLSVLGQFVRGNVAIGVLLAVVVLVNALFMWVLGVATLAAVRKWRVSTASE